MHAVNPDFSAWGFKEDPLQLHEDGPAHRCCRFEMAGRFIAVQVRMDQLGYVYGPTCQSIWARLDEPLVIVVVVVVVVTSASQDAMLVYTDLLFKWGGGRGKFSMAGVPHDFWKNAKFLYVFDLWFMATLIWSVEGLPNADKGFRLHFKVLPYLTHQSKPLFHGRNTMISYCCDTFNMISW